MSGRVEGPAILAESPPARHAFLILAHAHPQQFGRLVDALDHPGFDVYAHVDRKSDLASFTGAVGDRVRFTAKRFDVWRKCWSMIDATRELMATAVAADPEYHSLTLLSGADYPLRAPAALSAHLSAGRQELLHYFRLEDRPSWWHRVQRRHYRDHAYARQKQPRTLAVRREIAANWTRRIGHRVGRRTGQEHRPPGPMVLCGGSQWWTLTPAAVQHVLASLADRRVRDYFRYTDGPDEIVVQTLLYNSRFREQLRGHSAYEAWSRSERTGMLPETLFNGRYIDWSPERHERPPEGGAARGPATLDDRDFDALTASGALFGRKFHPVRSAALLDRIDAELLER